MEDLHPLNSTFIQHLVTCRDTDNLIIKGHLLTEHSLNHFIDKKSAEQINIAQTRFTFFNKIEIAKMLGLFKTNSELNAEIVLLNKLRNSIAHKLKYDDKILRDFLIGFEKYRPLYKSYTIDSLKSGNSMLYLMDDEKILIKGSHMLFMFYISAICQIIYHESEK